MLPLPVFGPPPPSPTPPDSYVGSSDSFFATQFSLRLSSCLDAPSPTLSAPRTVISARNRAILPFTKPATRPTAWNLARYPLPRAHARVSIAQLLSAATLPPVSHGGGAGTAEGALLLLGRRAVLRVEVVGVVEGGWVSGDRATYNVKDSSGGVIKCHCWLPAHPTAGGPGASAPASSAPKGVGFAVSPQESLLRTVRSAAAALAASSAAPTPEVFLGQGGLYPGDDKAGLTALSAPAPAPVFPPLGLATAAGPLRALKRGALTRIRGVVKVWAGEPEVHVTHMCGVGSAGDGDDSDDDDDDCSSGFGFLERDFVSSAPPQESSRRRSSGSESTSDALLSSPPMRMHACEAEALGGVALTCPLPPVPATTASTAPSETQEGQAGGSQGVDAIIESLARAVADRLEAEHAAETRKVWVKLRAAAAAADTAAVQAAAAAAAARKANDKATDSSDAPADKVSDTTTDKAVRLPQNGTISRGTARMSSARSHLFALVLSATPLCVTMPALCADPAIIAAARAAAEALTRLSTGVIHTHASKGDMGARLALQRALSVLVTKGALSRAAPMWVPVPARAGLGERMGKLWEMAKNAENAASVGAGAGAGAETEGKAGGSMYGRRRSAPTPGPVSGLKKAAAGPPVDSPAAAAAVAGSESHGSFGQLSRLKKLGYLSTVAATLASASAAPVATAATSPAAPVDAAESSSPSSQQQPPQQSSQQQSPQQQQQRRPPVRVRPPPDCLWVLTPGGHMVPRVLGMLREKAAAAAGAKAAADGAKAAAAEAKAAAAAVVEAAAEAEAAAAVAAAKAAALDAAAAELASVPAEEAVLFAASTAPAPAAASAAATATGAGAGAEGGAAAAAAVVVGAGGLRRRRAREAVRLLIRAGVIALVAHTPIGVAGDGGDEKDDGDGMALAQTRVRWREPAEGGGTIVIPVEK